jgi:hypothetical protein
MSNFNIMKAFKLSLFVLFSSFLFTSCLKDHCKRNFRMYIPIYKTRDAVLKEVGLTAARPIEHGGKIFSYGKYLFINEIDKGIHIIDNSNPSSPQRLGFLNIAGNLDLWVKNNLLYADCYDNLVVIDIKDMNTIKLAESVPSVFQQREYNGASIDASKGYVIGWDQRDTTISQECNSNGIYPVMSYKSEGVLMDMTSPGASGFTPPTGVSGSLTRFNNAGDYLYCIESSKLLSFNISSLKPVKSSEVDINWNMETIYSFNDNLFIGTSNGVLIYSILNPSMPVFKNKMEHVRTCDPVITDGQFAFLTLRGGSPCGGYTNQMDVLNVNDLQNISLVRSYTMTNPFGLGMNSKYIFICDENYGVRILDRSDVNQMNEVAKINVDHPRDIIVLPGALLLLTDSKMIQYDYSDIKNIKQLSILN